MAVLIMLLNLRRLVSGLRDRGLRAHPERAPRESAALWYDRMVSRMARRGWRKSPSQTPLDFVAAIQEAALQNKVGEVYPRLRVCTVRTVGRRRPEPARAFPGHHHRRNGEF